MARKKKEWPEGYPFCCGYPMEDLGEGDFVCSKCYKGVYWVWWEIPKGWRSW